jgi:hypothetical protein
VPFTDTNEVTQERNPVNARDVEKPLCITVYADTIKDSHWTETPGM